MNIIWAALVFFMALCSNAVRAENSVVLGNNNQDAVAELNSITVSCAPGKPTNDALPIFQSFKNELSGFMSEVVPKERTDNCIASLFVRLKEPSKIREIKIINTMVGLYALRKDRGVKACASGDIGCCGDIDNSYVQCVKDLGVDPNSTPLMKKWIAFPAMQALTHEIGKSSFIVPADDLSTVKIKGDEIFFIWPFSIKTDDSPVNYVLTKLDSDLIQRLMVGVNELAQTFRVISNRGYPGAPSYVCSSAGIVPRLYPKNPDNITLKVGSGSSTDVRRPPNIVYDKTLLINVLRVDGSEVSTLEMENSVSPPLGGNNRDLFDFAKLLAQQNLQPFPCYGQVISDVIKNPTSLRFFNSYSSSLLYLGLIYLNGFANESLMLPANMASTDITSNAPIDLKYERNMLTSQGKKFIDEIKNIAKTETNKKVVDVPINCPQLCSQGDPKCLLMELADEERYKGLRGLYAESMSARPHVITQTKIKELFGDHATSKYRTDIYLTKDKVLNSGSVPVFINLEVNKLFKIKMDFPIFVEAEMKSFNGKSMAVEFVEETKSPIITFSDEFFNNRFGGLLRRVVIENQNTFFETKNGCLQLPYQKSSDAEFNLRSARLSKDAIGIDLSKLVNLRNPEVSCSSSSDTPMNGKCSCKSCASVACCLNPEGNTGVCCEISTFDPDANGVCNAFARPECGCDTSPP